MGKWENGETEKGKNGEREKWEKKPLAFSL